MTLLWQIVFQILFLAGIFGIVDVHYHWFNANKKTGPWFHFLWGCVYFVPALYVGGIIFEDWKVCLLLAIERFVFYNPMLNLLRAKPFFYLSVNSGANSSLWDRIEIGWGKYYSYLWAFSVAGYIAIQFFV